MSKASGNQVRVGDSTGEVGVLVTEMDLLPNEIELCWATNYQSAPPLIACLTDLRVKNLPKLKKSALKKTVYQPTWSQCLHLFAVSDRGGASHGCDTGWIRAAAARPCCCSARLCNPPAQRFALLCAHNLLCCTLQQQAVLVCAHPAWETRRRLAGKFGASRGRAPPSPWSKSLLLLHCSAARSAAAHTSLPRWSKRCGSGRVRRDLCQGHGAPHCTADTSLHETVRARLPFRLGKTCLCFQHDGPASHCHIYLCGFTNISRMNSTFPQKTSQNN